MVAGTIDIGYQGYIYIRIWIFVVFFSCLIAFLLNLSLTSFSNLWQTFYRDKISI